MGLGTPFGGVALTGRAPALHAGGWRFESARLHHSGKHLQVDAPARRVQGTSDSVEEVFRLGATPVAVPGPAAPSSLPGELEAHPYSVELVGGHGHVPRQVDCGAQLLQRSGRPQYAKEDASRHDLSSGSRSAGQDGDSDRVKTDPLRRPAPRALAAPASPAREEADTQGSQ